MSSCQIHCIVLVFLMMSFLLLTPNIGSAQAQELDISDKPMTIGSASKGWEFTKLASEPDSDMDGLPDVYSVCNSMNETHFEVYLNQTTANAGYQWRVDLMNVSGFDRVGVSIYRFDRWIYQATIKVTNISMRVFSSFSGDLRYMLNFTKGGDKSMLIVSGTNSETMGVSTTSYAIGFSQTRKLQFAKSNYWMWYSNGTHLGYTLLWGWRWFHPVTPATQGTIFAVWMEGDYAYYCIHQSASYDLLFRRGFVYGNGTINWDAEQQVLRKKAGVVFYRLTIIVDSGGYPWIGYMWWDTFQTPYIIKSDTNDGTWSTQSGFPYQLHSSQSVNWGVVPAKMSSESIYVCYGRINGLLYGRLWNGTTDSWGTEEEISDNQIRDGGGGLSVFSRGDDIHAAWVLNDANATIKYRVRVFGSGWGNIETVHLPNEFKTRITLSNDQQWNTTFIFWQTLDSHIVYKRRTDQGWGDLVDWINESLDAYPDQGYGIPHQDYNLVSTLVQSPTSFMSILYVANLSSPYLIRIAHLQFWAPVPLDPPGIECQQYANISNYNSTHIIYSLTIWVYNHMGSAQSVNVTPDSRWSSWYIISSLANNATNSSSFYKNFERQSSDTNSTIQPASINFTQTQPCNSLLIMIPGARALIVEEFREETMAAAVIGLLILVPLAFVTLILLVRRMR